jgi:hypothetical protein
MRLIQYDAVGPGSRLIGHVWQRCRANAVSYWLVG